MTYVEEECGYGGMRSTGSDGGHCYNCGDTSDNAKEVAPVWLDKIAERFRR